MGSKNMLEPQIYYFQDRGDAASPGFELPIIFGTDNVNDTGQLKKKKIVFCLLLVHNGVAL